MLSSIINREELYPVKDCALLMTSADDFFWTFEQAVSYYQFALVNYIGFKDRGMVLAGGCGDTNGRPQIDKTEHLQEAYEFGKCISLKVHINREGRRQVLWEKDTGFMGKKKERLF